MSSTATGKRLPRRLIERRCRSCNRAWLLTRSQVRFSKGAGLSGPNPTGAAPISAFGAPSHAGTLAMDPGANDSGSFLAGGTPVAALGLAEVFRHCAVCGSGEFTDRTVNRKHLASPDASLDHLP